MNEQQMRGYLVTALLAGWAGMFVGAAMWLGGGAAVFCSGVSLMIIAGVRLMKLLDGR